MECATSTGGSVLDTLEVDVSCQTVALVKKSKKKKNEKLALEGIGLPLEVGSSL